MNQNTLPESADPKLAAPPYVTYAIFRNFVTRMSQDGLPDRIDPSVMPHIPGGTQPVLRTTLKWMGMTEGDGTTTDVFQRMLKKEDFPSVLRQQMMAKYPFLVNRTLDLQKCSGRQLEDEFRKMGQGSTVQKAVRFFVSAAKEAEIELGNHILNHYPLVSGNGMKKKGGRKKKASKRTAATSQVSADALGQLNHPLSAENPAGMVSIPIPLMGFEDRVGRLVLPREIVESEDDHDWEYAIGMLDAIVKGYRKKREKGG